MAIQDIQISKEQVTKGIDRKIDESSMGIIMDTIQITQYTKPEESTIRELTANAVDAQREKEIAIAILKNGEDPSNYFINRQGAKYEASKWKPEYYDLQYLNTENNNIELFYKENTGNEKDTGFCDSFEVIDHGVGIGEPRLPGYFQLGFSTKRNNNNSLGAWGFGAKASLSLRNHFYTVETVYNGKKFSFNCYAKKIVSNISKWNKDGANNSSFIFPDGYVAYYETTTSKNYTKITVPTKKIHRSRFKDAVRKQLLYFKNVKFFYQNEHRDQYELDFHANILYNSSNLIISDNNQFSRPHIVITKNNDEGQIGVCYGYIDFNELEMEQYRGNIGIKCPIRSTIEDPITGKETILQEGINVTPSRETVIWDEFTRDFVLQQFEAAAQEASTLVTEKLKETDFLKWISLCSSYNSKNDNSNDVVARLGQIVDSSKIEPKYIKNPKISYKGPKSMLWGINVRTVRTKKELISGVWKNTVDRIAPSYWSSTPLDHCYFKTETFSNLRDKYLLSTKGESTVFFLQDEDSLRLEFKETVLDKAIEDDVKAKLQRQFDFKLKLRNELWGYLTSSENIENYDDVEVPKDWKEVVEKEEEALVVASLSPAERRKLNQKVVYKQMQKKDYVSYGDTSAVDFVIREEKISKIETIFKDYYYGFQDDRNDLEAAGFFYRDKKPFILISKTNEKYFKEHCSHISEFFEKIENEMVTADNNVIVWNTVRAINEYWYKLAFLNNFEAINKDKADAYSKLKRYKNSSADIRPSDYNKRGLSDGNYKSLEEYFSKLTELQLFMEDFKDDEEAISAKIKEITGSPISDFAKGYLAIDMDIYNLCMELVEYAEPIYPLLNEIGAFTSYAEISDDLASQTKEFIKMRNE